MSWHLPVFYVNRKHTQGSTLLALRIWNIRGRPCVMSSSVYSSSSMQLNSFRRPWIRGRRCWWKHVRRDSSQVCKVHGTPKFHKYTNMKHISYNIRYCRSRMHAFPENPPRLRISMVMSTCPCSALWYMASFRALSLAFPVLIRSIWDMLLPSSSEPSARISSNDKTSPFPFSVWDNSLRNTFLQIKKGKRTKAEKKTAIRLNGFQDSIWLIFFFYQK